MIGRGRIIAAGPVQQVIDSAAGDTVRVRSPHAGELATALTTDGASVTSAEAGTLEISGTTTERVGEVAFRCGLLLHELSTHRASLEEAYMRLTQDAVEYRAHTTTTSRTEHGREPMSALTAAGRRPHTPPPRPTPPCRCIPPSEASCAKNGSSCCPCARRGGRWPPPPQ